jgi:hypothetical protein
MYRRDEFLGRYHRRSASHPSARAAKLIECEKTLFRAIWSAERQPRRHSGHRRLHWAILCGIRIGASGRYTQSDVGRQEGLGPPLAPKQRRKIRQLPQVEERDISLGAAELLPRPGGTDDASDGGVFVRRRRRRSRRQERADVVEVDGDETRMLPLAYSRWNNGNHPRSLVESVTTCCGRTRAKAGRSSRCAGVRTARPRDLLQPASPTSSRPRSSWTSRGTSAGRRLRRVGTERRVTRAPRTTAALAARFRPIRWPRPSRGRLPSRREDR